MGPASVHLADYSQDNMLDSRGKSVIFRAKTRPCAPNWVFPINREERKHLRTVRPHVRWHPPPLLGPPHNGLADYSNVNIVASRYKSVNFGAETSANRQRPLRRCGRTCVSPPAPLPGPPREVLPPLESSRLLELQPLVFVERVDPFRRVGPKTDGPICEDSRPNAWIMSASSRYPTSEFPITSEFSTELPNHKIRLLERLYRSRPAHHKRLKP